MTRAETYISLVRDLEGVYDEGPEGRDAIDQLEHSLQMGTRVYHAGLGMRWAAIAVLHDAFRIVAPLNHGAALAEALKDVLANDEYNVLKNHSVWQDDFVHGKNTTKRWSHMSWYADGSIFGKIDAASFDPDYESFDLKFFEAAIKLLFNENV